MSTDARTTRTDDWRDIKRLLLLVLVGLLLIGLAIEWQSGGIATAGRRTIGVVTGVARAVGNIASDIIGKTRVRWEGTMPSYQSTGAAEANANGLFSESGTYNDLPAYVNPAGWWLFNDGTPGGPWTISPAKGTYYPGYLGPGTPSSITGEYEPQGYDPGNATVAFGGYSITGTVLHNGTGLAGVLVTGYNGVTTLTDTTAANGTYSLDGAEPGAWEVTPSLTKYRFNPPFREIMVSDADFTGVDFTAQGVTMATAAYGTILRYPGPAVRDIAELTNISGVPLKQDAIDITSHDSDYGFREVVGGLLDGGEVTFEGNHIAAGLGQQRIMTHFNARDVRLMAIDLPDGSQWAFNALCVGFSPSGAPVDGKLDVSGTFRITGKPTLATAFVTGLTTPFFTLTGSDTGAISPTPAAANAVYAYTAALANADATLIVTPTAAQGIIRVGLTGATAIVASGANSAALAMSVGANNVYIAVDYTDQKRRLYTIVATRAAA